MAHLARRYPKTLQWRPTTEIDVADIDDEICSHALKLKSLRIPVWSRTRAAALPTDATDRLICNPRVS